jgi:hypothetical protein
MPPTPDTFTSLFASLRHLKRHGLIIEISAWLSSKISVFLNPLYPIAFA